MRSRLVSVLAIALALVGAFGCDGGSSSPDGGRPDGSVTPDSGPRPDAGGLEVPDTFEFESRFIPGRSSVAYTGQTARHVLIQDLKSYIGSLTAQIDEGTLTPTEGDVVARLEYFFSTPGAERVDDPIRLSTDPDTLQSTYGEISGTANLLGAVAGNQTDIDHRDWSTEFAGWSDASIAEHGGGIDTPTNLIRAFFATIEANALDRANGVSRLSPAGQELPVHVTESGLDFVQLTEKFLMGSLVFHQAADKYLDDAAKGLLSDNTMDATMGEGAGYTVLEHAWDEAFGYFGASRFYGNFTPASLQAGPIYADASGDGRIDLLTEYNFGASVNAGRRDNASDEAARTNFMGQAWLAFRVGRALITAAGGALSEQQMADLRAQRDLALGAWESALAASVVHYINRTLQVMADFGTPAYDHARFLSHAQWWSEAKGFAMIFQFNPRSPVSEADFARIHTLLGDSPVLPTTTGRTPEQYRADLREVRGIIGTAFGFDAANLGDDNGMNGW
jgi:hypothetical protein